MHILVVSQMFPGPSDPDLGVFVAQMADALAERGHYLDFAVLDRRAGGKRRFLELRDKVRRAPTPDVVWAHFLVPAGFIAAGVNAPLVVTAHGRDVRNIGELPGVAAITRRVVNRATTVIAVSQYLRDELHLRLPESRGKTVVINSGVDLDRFSPGDGTRFLDLLRPVFLAVGHLSERKNVLRLADAFERVGTGTLAFLGSGPLGRDLERRAGVRVFGPVAHTDVPDYMRSADIICAPSMLEPFGQGVLEAMAVGRTVVATRLGGPPEFVTRDAGLLVDPLDATQLAEALESALDFPSPNLAARDAAAPNDVRLQAGRVEEVLLQAVAGRQAGVR